MWKYVKTFVTWDQIQAQLEEMKLYNDKMRNVLTDYSTEHEQHKEMIRRFDEVISNKVDKERLKKLKKQTATIYETKNESYVSQQLIKDSLHQLEQGLNRESVSKQQLMLKVVK